MPSQSLAFFRVTASVRVPSEALDTSELNDLVIVRRLATPRQGVRSPWHLIALVLPLAGQQFKSGIRRCSADLTLASHVGTCARCRQQGFLKQRSVGFEDLLCQPVNGYRTLCHAGLKGNGTIREIFRLCRARRPDMHVANTFASPKVMACDRHRLPPTQARARTKTTPCWCQPCRPRSPVFLDRTRSST